ncbi:HTH-type transcriptional regulator PrtR [compost metagenome]
MRIISQYLGICRTNNAGYTLIGMDYLDASQLPTIGSRVEYARSQRGISQESLAERAGCSQAAIQKVISGKTQRSKYLPAIARALDVDVNWLEIGAIPSLKPTGLAAQGSKRPNDGGPAVLGELALWDDETPLDEDEVELPIYKEVELSSGHGRSEVQLVEGRKVRFSLRTLKAAGVDPANAACGTNTGNSNFPLILPKATLGIDRGMTRIIDGQIYAIDHDGMMRVKFLYRLPGGGLRLRSYNRAEYEDEEYTFDQIMEQRLQIIGRVFWWSTLNPTTSQPLM